MLLKTKNVSVYYCSDHSLWGSHRSCLKRCWSEVNIAKDIRKIVFKKNKKNTHTQKKQLSGFINVEVQVNIFIFKGQNP